MRITLPFPSAGAGVSPAPADRRWLAVPPTLALIAALLFWWLPSRLAPVTTTTTTSVAQGSLTITVAGSGAVAAARTADLAFPEATTVTAVKVKVGDQVKAGQALAQIDAADLQLQLQQAQANLKAAQAKLDQARHGSPTDADLATAQAALASAKAQMAKTRTASVTDVQSAQAQLAAAQAKLAALQSPGPADLSAAQTQLAQAQTNQQTTSASLSQAKSSAYNTMQQAANSLTQAQSKYSTAFQNWQYVQGTGNDPVNPTKTSAQGKAVANTLNDAQRQQYYDAFVQAQAAMHSAEGALQQAQVNYDTARQNEAAQVPLLQQQVANAQAQLDKLTHPTASDLQQAQAAVTQARTQLASLQGGGTSANLASAQSQLAQAQANLDKLTAPAAAPDLAAAEASLAQAQVSVATAQRNLDQATLAAPFDAVVSAVNVQPGSIASATTAAVALVDRSKLHVDVSLSETDAARVQVGQPVTLTFDALPNVQLIGKVTTVAPAATVQQNVVTYPVQVEFDPGSAPVKVGMSASADILVQQIDNAVLVPSRAVQTLGNTRSVTVLQGSDQIPVTVQVETGATSSGQTVITGCVDTGAQCLREGDLLAIPAATTSQATNRNGTGGALRVPFGPGGGR